MPRGLCGSRGCSWTDLGLKCKLIGLDESQKCESRNRLPGRSTKELSEQSGIRLEKLKPFN